MDIENLPDPFEKFLPENEDILNEPALLELFTERVDEMIRHDLGLLLSSLYRLDVEEHKIQSVLNSPDIPTARGLAQLIIDRQKEKIKTRKEYSTGKKKDWEGL
jgi:hypothetical protein